MQVNFKSFKVETVDPTQTDGTPGYDPKAEEVENDLNGIFGDQTGTTAAAPQDEWVINDPTAPSSEADSITLLSDYPPSLEEIVAANEQSVRYLDVIKTRYEKTKADLITLRDSYTEALPNVSASEAAILQQKIDLVNKAIAKCDHEIDKTEKRMEGDAKIYDQEKTNGKDLNGDGRIGRPGAQGSLKVVYDADGKPHYIDADGNAVKAPMLDPDYEAQIINDDSLTVIGADEAVGASDSESNTDIYFKLNELKQNYESDANRFGTPINIGVPEYLWVKREGKSWDPKLDENSDETEYVFDPDLWVGGVQKTPEEMGKNKSDYVQVRVAAVEVSSEEISGLTTSDGGKLYHTVVKFKAEGAEGPVIATMRIEGYFGGGPASAPTDQGSYVAASSVGIGFFGSNRTSPIIFDASGYESTGRHILSNFADSLGIGGKDGMAYDENKAAFEGASFTTKHLEITGEGENSTSEWVDDSHSFDYGDGYSDRYTPEQPGSKDSLLQFQSGVFTTGLRGELKGSQYNDIFDVPDVNDLSDYAKEHLAEDAEPIRPSDPFYTTVVEGGGGNNVVRAGKGDLYARDVSFAWVEASSKDTVVISVPTASILGKDDKESETSIADTKNNDPKNFVYVNGAGSSYLYDDGENWTSKEKAFAEGYKGDDYYDLSGKVKVSKPDDTDIVGKNLNSANMADDFTTFWSNEVEEVKTQLEDVLAGNNEEDEEFDAGTKWEEEFGYAAEQDAEMDQFFNDMFGDLNEFQVEMTEMTGQS